MQFNNPMDALRYHVSGAIDRGEKEAIVNIPADMEAYIDEAVEQAAITVLWQASDASENGGNGFPIGEEGNEWSRRVAEEVPYIREATTAFVRANWETLQRVAAQHGYDAGQCGRDIVLTANHHGAGFWDRELGADGDALTEATQDYEFNAEFELNDEGEPAFIMVQNVVLLDTLGYTDDEGE